MIKKTISSFTNAEESSGFLLWQVTSLWQRSLNTLLKKHSLTHAQFIVLMSAYWLQEHTTNVTQIHIADHAQMDSMFVSNVLKMLEEKKLIIRSSSKIDTRAKVVKVTVLGIKILRPAAKAVEGFDERFFSVLGNKSELSTFNKFLLKLIK